MGELLAVLSGKGGTGKTSVCAGVATALAASGKRVLCIDCDVGLRNLDLSLGLSDSGAVSFVEVCRGIYPLQQAARHPVYESLSFLTAPVSCPWEEIDGAAFGRLLQQARSLFDYVLMDAPAGVEQGFRLAAAHADRCLLVTGASPAAIRDAARTGQLLEQMGKKQIRLIVNRVERELIETMAVTIDDIMDAAGLPLLGVVPEDPNVTLAAAFGEPLLRFYKRSEAGKAFRRIANRIQGLSEPISIR